MRLSGFLTFLSLVAISSTGAIAADPAPEGGCSSPCVEYTGSFDLNAAWLHPSDASVGNSWIVGPSSEIGFTLRPIDGFSVVGNVVTEPVVDAEPGKDQIFSGIGTYMDVLQAQYEFGDFGVWAGKIHPAFGRAWDVTPGLHGTDIAENYELSERIGGGAGYNFDAAGLAHRVEVSAFTTDRTILSESLFNNRGPLGLSDGGAGNTSGISSVAASLSGCIGAEPDSCYDDGSFGYQVAARYQKGGAGSSGDEFGLSGSVNKSFSIGEDKTLKVFGEAVWLRNFDGTADNALFVTGSAAIEIDAMTYSAAYTQQHTFAAGGADTTEHHFDVTAKYDVSDFVSFAGEKWSVGVGYDFDRVGGENSHMIGLKLSSEFAGSIAPGN